ncbi:MAG: hypothetical protein VCA74_02105 [Deltaproteobacteria bacterium]
MAPESRLLACHGCGQTQQVEGPVSRGAGCSRCGVALRCCRNCEFYQPSAYNECAEPVAERVVDKELANFCDYFSAAGPAVGLTATGGDAPTPADAVEDLEELFKK